MPDTDTRSESGSTALMSAKELFVKALMALNSEIASEDISRDELDDIDVLLWSANASIKRAIKSSVTKAMNALCFVNRLPPELLRIVFRQCVRPTTLPGLAQRGKTQSFGWTHTHMWVSDVLKLTHICRRWREIVFLSPHMWTSIRDVHVEETKAFLKRAQDLPLQVTISACPPWLLNVFAKRSESIRALHWVSPTRNTVAEALSDIQAPNVEQLSLFRGPNGAVYSDTVILNGATQNVKMLSMNDLGWYPTNRFPALTHLVISARELQAHKFRTFLSRCPNLAVLVIQSSSTCNIRAPPAQLPAVPYLSHLRKVSLHTRLVNLLPILPINRACTTIELTKDVFRSPRGFVNRLLAHPDYARQPLFRLYLKDTSETESPDEWNSLMLTNGTGGICFKSTSGLSTQTASLFVRYGDLDNVTELWVDNVDVNVFRLCTVIRPGLLNLRTLSVLRADHANSTSALSMLVQYARMEAKGTTGALLAPPALRLVLENGADLDARKATMLAILGGADAPLRWEKKDRRLILRARQFSPEYYTAIVPRLLTRWESVETEAGSGGDDALPVTRADDGFTAWEEEA
ncbi:uncharacterized protein TRAVEDRAFT_46837 [Trametes versicolor FP-101664 SS1]|uniref:uncharacterized protein n=1 Tax=Trametes versicolor (strain FP-101664) TaxID=717944 RepID=UPI000462256E|nr:uncharacterized protein TRAVEDRAFT_46837 [Trametes versicolor FP-101664 SS1]EIW59530.1 hypothetical protein TRAVEDRAFT_46837 [Trametes versicolor FP-101664 SS1]